MTNIFSRLQISQLEGNLIISYVGKVHGLAYVVNNVVVDWQWEITSNQIVRKTIRLYSYWKGPLKTVIWMTMEVSAK